MFVTIYAVSFTLGLIRSVEAVATCPTVETILLATALALIGMRLIFSPDALRQYVRLCRTVNKPVAPISLVGWHFPILLFQATTLYAACFTLKEGGAESRLVTWLAVGTLALNATWLLSKIGGALRREIKLSRLGRPLFWFWNNLLFVVVVFIILRFVPQYTVPLAAMALLANSVIDLWFTAKWYQLPAGYAAQRRN